MNKIRKIKSAIPNNSHLIISKNPGNMNKNNELIKDSVSNIFYLFKSINNTYILISK